MASARLFHRTYPQFCSFLQSFAICSCCPVQVNHSHSPIKAIGKQISKPCLNSRLQSPQFYPGCNYSVLLCRPSRCSCNHCRAQADCSQPHVKNHFAALPKSKVSGYLQNHNPPCFQHQLNASPNPKAHDLNIGQIRRRPAVTAAMPAPPTDDHLSCG